MIVFQSRAFDRPYQSAQHPIGDLIPTVLIDDRDVQVIPILPMRAGHGQTQGNFRINVLILFQTLLDLRISHAMVINLIGDVVFYPFACGRTDTADGIVSLKCFGDGGAYEMLQSAFDAANHLRRRNGGFGADEELTGVAGGSAVFENAYAIGFGDVTEFSQPEVVVNWLVAPKDGKAPIQLIGGFGIGYRVDRFHRMGSVIC